MSGISPFQGLIARPIVTNLQGRDIREARLVCRNWNLYIVQIEREKYSADLETVIKIFGRIPAGVSFRITSADQVFPVTGTDQNLANLVNAFFKAKCALVGALKALPAAEVDELEAQAGKEVPQSLPRLFELARFNGEFVRAVNEGRVEEAAMMVINTPQQLGHHILNNRHKLTHQPSCLFESDLEEICLNDELDLVRSGVATPRQHRYAILLSIFLRRFDVFRELTANGFPPFKQYMMSDEAISFACQYRGTTDGYKWTAENLATIKEDFLAVLRG